MGEQQLEDESMSSDSPKFRKIINELLDYEHRDHDLRNTRFGKGLLFVICNVPFYLAAIIIGATTFGTCVMTENIPEGAPGTNPGQSMNLFLILYGSIALFFNLLVGLVLVALFHNMSKCSEMIICYSF
jgi:hypothetical protein